VAADISPSTVADSVVLPPELLFYIFCRFLSETLLSLTPIHLIVERICTRFSRRAPVSPDEILLVEMVAMVELVFAI